MFIFIIFKNIGISAWIFPNIFEDVNLYDFNRDLLYIYLNLYILMKKIKISSILQELECSF